MPLRIFEQRYQTMFDHVIDGDGSFGQVAIERGSDVGGNDTRSAIGCRAEILDYERQPDGTIALVVAGRDRIAVVEWLPDAPYPRAFVEPVVDRPDRAEDSSNEDQAARAVTAGLAELGAEVDAVWSAWTASDDWTFAALAALPANPLDAVRVLSARHRSDRAVALVDIVEHIVALRRWNT